MAISVENRQFFPPRVFCALAEWGYPWNWVSGQGSDKTRMMWIPEGQKEL